MRRSSLVVLVLYDVTLMRYTRLSAVISVSDPLLSSGTLLHCKVVDALALRVEALNHFPFVPRITCSNAVFT